MLAYGSRKNRNNRKNRKISRRNRMYGGAAYVLSPMGVNDSLAGSSPSQMNLAQGEQYGAFHAKQHGGMAAYPMSVVDSLLPSDMAASARVTPLNTYINDVKGLRDPGQEAQMGGRRRRTRNSRGRFTKKRAGKKARKGTKRSGRKGTKRNGRKRNASGRFLKMRGGAVQPALDLAASANAPGMLLDAGAEARAVRGMNPEWSLAPNPNSFAPRV
jgi:hypothetical protein